MIIWDCSLQTSQPLAHWPLITTIRKEEIHSPGYRWAGKHRNDHHWCFQYTLSGEGELTWRNKTYPLPKETGFLCDPADPDLEYYYPKSSSKPWEFIYITFLGDIDHLLKPYMEEHGIIYSLKQSSKFIEYLLNHKDQAHRWISPIESMTRLTQLLSDLEGERCIDRPEIQLHPLIEKAILSLEDDDGLKSNVSDVAKHCHVSREHLTRLFQKECGCSPYQYIVQKRMEKAKRLLKTSKINCKGLSELCGFESATQFSTVFKRLLGMTPLKYRSSSGGS
jgi:AraC-like DNA-binding protein